MGTLETAGLLIWWAEGSKSRRDKRWRTAVSYPVEVTNTDARIIQLFMKFMNEEMLVRPDRFKLQLQIHRGDNQKSLEKYWSNVTGIPHAHFQKTIVRPTGNKPGKSKGTCKVRFSDKLVYNALEKRLQALLENISGCGAAG